VTTAPEIFGGATSLPGGRQEWNWSRVPELCPVRQELAWFKAVLRSAACSIVSGDFGCWWKGFIDYAIYMLDPDGIITNWNAGARRIKGYEAEEVIGRHFGMFYPPEDREAGMPARSLATAREKGKFEAEGWRLRNDGTKFLASVVIDAIYEDGELIGFAKITRDITERNKSAQALKESERHFRLLVNGVIDYALYMLDPNGIVSNWNAGGQRIKGYLPEEIIGQHFSRFYSPADQAAGRPARALQLALENGRYEEEGWRVRKDGTFFGPASSSIRFVTMTTSCSALPRSHAIFPSVEKPS